MPVSLPAKTNGGKAPQIVSLTSLRFFAAMAVVVYHYFGLGILTNVEHGDPETLGPVSHWIYDYLPAFGYGHLAVDFFFVLSGFVLAHVYSRQLENGNFDYANFLKRRFARLYPLHLTTMLASGSLFLIAVQLEIPINHPEAFTLRGLFSNLLLIRGLNLTKTLTFNGPAWCVSSEWQLYLLFPVLAYVVLRRSIKPIVMLAATVAFFLLAYYGTSHDQLLTHRTYNFGILRALVEFPIGLALYRVFQDYQTSKRTWCKPWHIALVGAAIFVLLQLRIDESAAVLLMVTLIFVCAAAEEHYQLAWLKHPWLVYGGMLSYAIYLIHAPFLACFRKLFPLLGAAPGSLIEGFLQLLCAFLVVPAAAATYEWIERPASRWTLSLLTDSPAKCAEA